MADLEIFRKQLIDMNVQEVIELDALLTKSTS
jgi:hypothetical protein